MIENRNYMQTVKSEMNRLRCLTLAARSVSEYEFYKNRYDAQLLAFATAMNLHPQELENLLQELDKITEMKSKVKAILTAMESEKDVCQSAVERYPGYARTEWFEGKVAAIRYWMSMIEEVFKEEDNE